MLSASTARPLWILFDDGEVVLVVAVVVVTVLGSLCCPHADSLARSPVHSCPLVFVRSSYARFGRARHLSAVIPPATTGTQDAASGPAMPF